MQPLDSFSDPQVRLQGDAGFARNYYQQADDVRRPTREERAHYYRERFSGFQISVEYTTHLTHGTLTGQARAHFMKNEAT